MTACLIFFLTSYLYSSCKDIFNDSSWELCLSIFFKWVVPRRANVDMIGEFTSSTSSNLGVLVMLKRGLQKFMLYKKTSWADGESFRFWNSFMVKRGGGCRQQHGPKFRLCSLLWPRPPAAPRPVHGRPFWTGENPHFESARTDTRPLLPPRAADSSVQSWPN